MASCAIGVSATPAGDKARDALPDIPPIEAPEQRPPYPFPEFNDASGDILPTEEPGYGAPVDVAPPADDVPVAPGDEPADLGDQPVDGGEPSDSEEPGEPTDPGKPKPSNDQSSSDYWIPPIGAEESPEPTPEATAEAGPPEETPDGDDRETYRRD
jgi:hypothetical protein